MEDDSVMEALGSAIRAWHAEVTRQDDACELVVQGPLPAHGMDPVWIMQVRSPWRESELFLFRGPHAEVTWFDPRQPEVGAFAEAHDDLTAESITHLLDRLVHGDARTA